MKTNGRGALRAAAAGFCLAISGCHSLSANQDDARASRLANAAELHGRVSAAGSGASSIVVVAFDRGAGRITHRAFLAEDRVFALPLAAGRYKIYAFADQDQDGALGPGEPRSVMYTLASTLRAGERRELPAFTLR